MFRPQLRDGIHQRLPISEPFRLPFTSSQNLFGPSQQEFLPVRRVETANYEGIPPKGPRIDRIHSGMETTAGCTPCSSALPRISANLAAVTPVCIADTAASPEELACWF